MILNCDNKRLSHLQFLQNGQVEGDIRVLPDVLAPNLKLVICGTAAGKESARRQAYYAGRGNKLWSTLYRVGLTPA